ncbi:hypothetical protein [Flagellimonas flava]|uniref:hypothetical protein n=1 Tax=Flagellimonas flava TaxID=570519 RepID=UPI003D64D5CD
MKKQKEPDNRKPYERNPLAVKFFEERNDYTDKELLLEHLSAQKALLDKMEKVRSNTAVLVNFWTVCFIAMLLYVAFLIFNN